MSEIKLQYGIASGAPDEQMLFIQQQGMKYVNVALSNEDSNYDAIMRLRERLDRFGLIPSDAGNPRIQFHPSILFGRSDRDEYIDRFNNFTRDIGKAGIRITYASWKANPIQTTRIGIGEHTNRADARIVDLNQLNTLPYSHGREYTEEETWATFKYFIERVIPVCEEADVRLAMHPSDPPVQMMQGIYNLIHSAKDYRRAFELAGDSPYLGMKMCVGCWLEGGDVFGDLMSDIKEFVDRKKVFIVHFRNVSAQLLYFEETLPENGYMDMYSVMKQYVRCQYDGYLYSDHAPLFSEQYGGRHSAYAYSNGYIKALLKCAEAELEN